MTAGDSDLTTLRDLLSDRAIHLPFCARHHQNCRGCRGQAALGRLVALLEARNDPEPCEFCGDGPCPNDCAAQDEPIPGSARGARSGADLIAAERSRQMAAEGWTTEHDDKHDGGELAAAACCYATEPRIRANIMLSPDGEANVNVPGSGYDPRHWPAEWTGWWKPCPDDRVRELVKAGALVAAEIDRLQRAVSTSGGSAASPNAPEPEAARAGELAWRQAAVDEQERRLKAEAELGAAQAALRELLATCASPSCRQCGEVRSRVAALAGVGGDAPHSGQEQEAGGDVRRPSGGEPDVHG